MRRRHIALQPATDQWRYAVASGDQQNTELVQAGFFIRDPDRSLADQLGEIISPLQFSDRLAWALPASKAQVRWIEFPFTDKRKIAATAKPEMLRQLPSTTTPYAVFHQLQSDNQALTVAIDPTEIETAIDQFDDNHEPLGYLGLAPFCYADTLEGSEDGLLLCLEDNELSLLRCVAGLPVDLRILPRTTLDDRADIVQQVLLMARSAAEPVLAVQLLGISAESELAQSLRDTGFKVAPVQVKCNQGPLVEELVSTACLALTACKADSKTLNLRSGVYKLKNDWQVLKRRTFVAGGLLAATLLVLFTSSVMNYRQQSGKIKDLRQQLNTLYQQEFPGEQLVAPAPLLLQSKIRELQSRTSQLGATNPGALELLLAISENVAPELSVDIKEYLHNEEGIRLSGTTTNFDAVSKLLARLQANPHFARVRIIDSKQSLDGKQVDFQMQIQLGEKS